ncbi:MAG: hypothetical protein U0821_12225 [Chloroflexota bacterium]
MNLGKRISRRSFVRTALGTTLGIAAAGFALQAPSADAATCYLKVVPASGVSIATINKKYKTKTVSVTGATYTLSSVDPAATVAAMKLDTALVKSAALSCSTGGGGVHTNEDSGSD